MAKAEVSLPKIMRGVTLEVVVIGVKRTQVRIWLGCKIMILAAMIMGCTIKVEMES